MRHHEFCECTDGSGVCRICREPMGGAVTKRVPCAGPGCSDRRAHYTQQDTPRGTQWVEVPENYTGPAYCSVICMVLAKAQEQDE